MMRPSIVRSLGRAVHRAAPLAALAAVLWGCTGTVGSSPGGATGAGPEGPAGLIGPVSDGRGGGASAGSMAGSIEPAPTALRRLTNEEYRNTLRDLLRLAAPPADDLQPETRSAGQDNLAALLTVSATLAGQYEAIAARLAAGFDVARDAPCTGDEAACAGRFITGFGRRAFRRPLTPGEVEDYRALFAAGREVGGYQDGIRTVVEGMLTSPFFLYRFELGTPAAGARRLLTAHEIASLLSYGLTGTMPDAELDEAADSGRLSSPAEVERQARRLMGTPAARAPVRRAILVWWGLGTLHQLRKDSESHPAFTPALHAAMMAETERFIDAVLWERGGQLSALFTSRDSFVNEVLARDVYGVSGVTGEAMRPVQLPAGERAGLLTQASVLATHSPTGSGLPISRGKFVRKSLLCQPLPPPPPGEATVPPPPNPDLTTRERFAQHSANPTCASCHRLIDPLGFGLGHYDGLGAYQTHESGRPIDASGELVGTADADGPFRGAIELAARLASSVTTAECAVLQFGRVLHGRVEGDGDRAIAASVAALHGRDPDLRELLVSLSRTEPFYVRSQAP